MANEESDRRGSAARLPRPPDWFGKLDRERKVGVFAGCVVVARGLLWGLVIPAVGRVVGRVPVVSTVVGWPFAGAAFAPSACC